MRSNAALPLELHLAFWMSACVALAGCHSKEHKTASVDLPPGAPYSVARVEAYLETFQAPLPISPIGGPDCAYGAVLQLEPGGPAVPLFGDKWGVRTDGWFKALEEGTLRLVADPDGHAVAWSLDGKAWYGVYLDTVWKGRRYPFACIHEQVNSGALPRTAEAARAILASPEARSALNQTSADGEPEEHSELAGAVATALAHPDDLQLLSALVAFPGRWDKYSSTTRDIREVVRTALLSEEAAAALAVVGAAAAQRGDEDELDRLERIHPDFPGLPQRPSIAGTLEVDGGLSTSGKVQLWKSVGRAAETLELEVSTAEGGTFAVEHLPWGAEYGLVGTVDGMLPGSERVTVPARRVRLKVHRAELPLRLRVTMLGEPLPDAEVVVHRHRAPQRQSDAAGWVSFPEIETARGKCGRMEVDVWAKGVLPRRVDLKKTQDGSFEADLGPTVTIEGRLVSEARRPIAGARIWTGGWAGIPRREATTDAKGRFRLEQVDPRDANVRLTAKLGGGEERVIGPWTTGRPEKPQLYLLLGAVH